MANRPEKTRDYVKHPIIDSTRWNSFKPREGDIIISTSYKAGTTWTQNIIANLLFQDGEFPDAVGMMSPWFDMAMFPLELVNEGLEKQTHRRFIKTHLPADALPYYENVKYVVVGRDGRDVFMSLVNHHNNYSDDMMAAFHRVCDEGNWPAFPGPYEDVRSFWCDWIAKGWFEWESDGYPYWSHFHHAQSWWERRHLPNILFLHFTDLLNDPEAEVKRLASFLDIEIDPTKMPGILERISFKSMRDNFDNIMPGADGVWDGGGKTFMNKGVNGRWLDVLTEDDLKLYESAVGKALSPECRSWLENGGPLTD